MPNKRTSILIVDDHDDLLTALAQVFAQCGFSVRVAANGSEALAAIGQDVPDILLSDLEMPAMRGSELLSVVRRRYPTIGVVAMSGGYLGDAMSTEIAADAFYAKGCASPSSLFAMVTELLEHRRMHRPQLPAPIWIRPFSMEHQYEGATVIWCPDCLQTFAERAELFDTQLSNASCPQCSCEMKLGLLKFSSEESSLDKTIALFGEGQMIGTAA
jgi:CheY-like chemotaxis protein